MALTADRPRPPAIHPNDALHRAAIVLRGLVAIALGVVALGYRGYTSLLIGAFVAFAFVDGIARLVIALRSTGRDRAWLIHALEGLITIAFGVVALRIVHEIISLVWTIAEWAFGIGALTIVFALVVWGRLHDAWLWFLAGLLLIALGAVLLWLTGFGLLAPATALGLFGIVYGIVSILIAVRSHH